MPKDKTGSDTGGKGQHNRTAHQESGHQPTIRVKGSATNKTPTAASKAHLFPQLLLRGFSHISYGFC